MGKPKKLSFPCSYCGKEFKRKINLNKHLLCHSDFTSKTRVARESSKWCHVCKRNFAESDYKLHIETEHKFDSYKRNSGNTDEKNYCKPKDPLHHVYNAKDFLTDDDKYIISTATNSREVDKIISGKLYKKRGRKPGKTFQSASINTHLKVKTEPPDTSETNVSIFESKNMISNASSVTCKLCNFKCKTLRGIKIHFSTIHKKKSGNKCILKKSLLSQKILKTDQIIKKEPQNDDLDQVNSPMNTYSNSQPVFNTNSLSDANQNAQTGMIYSIFPNQSFTNFSGTSYQPNIQNSFKVENQNEEVETIPMFDCDSEKYIKWLKNFISRCKMHKYPLPPMMCQSLSHINEEISSALAFPENSMRKRSNHFYFMQIQRTLSEIMAGQLRYSMNVVTR